MRKISILAFLCVAACQPSSPSSSPSTSQSSSAVNLTVFNAPASDDIETLDLTKLPDGFPIIGEIGVSTPPQGCKLSKANRIVLDGKATDTDYDSRYVFTSSGQDTYQLGITGNLRTVKQSGSADMDGKKVRYFKTVSGPEVEIQVVTEPTPDGGHKGIVGRIKAWDADVPLMCGYNRVEVVGDCDL